MNESSSPGLTHVDAQGRPRMVDVGDKAITPRRASAQARVVFPDDVAAQLRAVHLRVGKGSVVDTAIIAGTMAVKRTAELIPFCHPLPILGCRIGIDWIDDSVLGIDCDVRTEHRTGVEMEALTAVATACLTIYDMLKAAEKGMRIEGIRLIRKSGGKSGDYEAK